MKIERFPTSDMLYIRLLPGASTESAEVAPGFILDYDAEGRVVGIEHASTRADLDALDLTAGPFPTLRLAPVQEAV